MNINRTKIFPELYYLGSGCLRVITPRLRNPPYGENPMFLKHSRFSFGSFNMGRISLHRKIRKKTINDFCISCVEQWKFLEKVSN